MDFQSSGVDIHALLMSCRSYIFEWTQCDFVKILRLGRWEDLKVCEAKLNDVRTDNETDETILQTCCSNAFLRGDADARITRFELRC
jgi:hypothetical protein